MLAPIRLTGVAGLRCGARWLGAGAVVAALSACTVGAPDSVGLRDGQLAPCPPSPNCVSSLARNEEHAVDAFFLSSKAADAPWPALRAAVELLPRTVVVEARDDYLRAESTSALFRFLDDLELHWTGGGVVQVRSAARVGHSDLGVNRKRVEQLRGFLVERGLITAPAM